MSVNKLCDGCKNLPSTVFYSDQDGSLPTSPAVCQLFKGLDAFKALQLSADAGCILCTLFREALQLCKNVSPEEAPKAYPESCKNGITLGRIQDFAPSIFISFGSSCFQVLRTRLLIHGDGSPASTDRVLESGSLVGPEADSEANFALARLWLAECRMNHPACQASFELELPRRLLDVSVSPAEPGYVRLCPTSGLYGKGIVEYAALSHCWGSNPPLKTINSNLDSHIKGIPETQLPPTFYDAVRTTRELGLRHLWIDSLCILQDDPGDFETECARMNSVYAGATCTLAASDSRDSSQGLFASRTMKPVQLNYDKLTVTIEPTFHDPIMREISGPLQRRAWTFQERQLSPRIIHYTKKCLVWECRTAMASEHVPEMKVIDSDIYYDPRFLDAAVPSSGRRGRWYNAILDYSRRLLTFPEDKLPAFAGFAAEWQRLNPEDEYLAGLWKSDIFAGLSWRGFVPCTECDAAWPPVNRFPGIPSWSWAAFDGPVVHVVDDKLDLGPSPPQIHHISVTTVGQNPFGHVSGGKLTLSCWSAEVNVSESDRQPSIRDSDTGLELDMMKLYGIGWPGIEDYCAALIVFDYQPFCLPSSQILLIELPQEQQSGMGGLALLREVDSQKAEQDVYKRVGTFAIDYRKHWDARREWKTITIV